LVASIAAVASISAAFVAAFSARSTKQIELRSQHARELEARISEEKSNTYRPIIEMLGNVLSNPSNDGTESAAFDPKVAGAFATWVAIYGSDDALIAYHNFMQSAFNTAPAPILARLYAEFIIAARRDIGYPETQIKAGHLLGLRITDLYSDEDYRLAVTLPFAELCRSNDWTPPWLASIQKANAPSPTTPAPSS